jgi:hypothetical protein
MARKIFLTVGWSLLFLSGLSLTYGSVAVIMMSIADSGLPTFWIGVLWILLIGFGVFLNFVSVIELYKLHKKRRVI